MLPQNKRFLRISPQNINKQLIMPACDVADFRWSLPPAAQWAVWCQTGDAWPGAGMAHDTNLGPAMMTLDLVREWLTTRT